MEQFDAENLSKIKGYFDSVAQLVEHNTFNVGVLGSSPSRITKALLRSAFLVSKVIYINLV